MKSRVVVADLPDVRAEVEHSISIEENRILNDVDAGYAADDSHIDEHLERLEASLLRRWAIQYLERRRARRDSETDQ